MIDPPREIPMEEFANRADKCYELNRDGKLSELKGDKDECLVGYTCV